MVKEQFEGEGVQVFSGCLTVDEVWMIRLVRREDCGHLVVVCGVDVFINAVPRQLYLLKWTFVIAVKQWDIGWI